MFTIVKFFTAPLYARQNRLRASILDHPPLPPNNVNDWSYGPYCFKATVEAVDGEGIDRTFIGYSQNVDITERVALCCNRYKREGTLCTEPSLTMKGGESDEAVFMKLKNSEKLHRLII